MLVGHSYILPDFYDNTVIRHQHRSLGQPVLTIGFVRLDGYLRQC